MLVLLIKPPQLLYLEDLDQKITPVVSLSLYLASLDVYAQSSSPHADILAATVAARTISEGLLMPTCPTGHKDSPIGSLSNYGDRR